jgi:hypothetical protein
MPRKPVRSKRRTALIDETTPMQRFLLYAACRRFLQENARLASQDKAWLDQMGLSALEYFRQYQKEMQERYEYQLQERAKKAIAADPDKVIPLKPKR